MLAAWTLALGLTALTLLGAMSIGMFVAPFAIAAVVLAVRQGHAALEPLWGGLLGVGIVSLFVAFRSRGYSPCPPAGTPVLFGPGQSGGCGGMDPMPWLVVGALLLAAGLLGAVASGRSRRRVAG